MTSKTDPGGANGLCPALRMAAAGARDLGDARPAVAARMADLFEDLALALPTATGGVTSSGHAARLTLLTGLADGVDQCLATAFLDTKQDVAGPERAHIAVLPFNEADYRDRSAIEDQAEFNRLLARSSLVIELDGRWLDPEGRQSAPLARQARKRAYRAQARLMLNRADLLIAVLDPDVAGQPGGTAETVRTALDMRLPVLLLALDAGGPVLHLLREVAEWEALQAGPDMATAITRDQQRERIQQLVDDLVPPALSLGEPPAESWLEGSWNRFLKAFERPPLEASASAPGASSSPSDDAAAQGASPFATIRRQASLLNRRYSGRYRGGFLNNFRFAACATALAALSLGLMVVGYKFEHGGLPEELKAFLVLLALGKLALVVTIYRTTEQARHCTWNEEAVQSRYLAENLRLLLWLPAMGRMRPPQATGKHHADERLGHRPASVLLHAAVRAAPADTGLTMHAGTTPPRGRVDTRGAVKTLQHAWIKEQRAYHERNARVLGHLVERLNWRVEWLNKVVIGCVALDIVLLGLGMALHLPNGLATPVDLLKVLLVIIAASLPAVVAATNGIREQSEARRLADRSQQLAQSLHMLGADADRLIERMDSLAGGEEDPGAWVLESLQLAERCAWLVAEDVAEWSVLYGKEMLEA